MMIPHVHYLLNLKPSTSPHIAGLPTMVPVSNVHYASAFITEERHSLRVRPPHIYIAPRLPVHHSVWP